MPRLGLVNIYLKVGLVLILIGLGCGAWFALSPRAGNPPGSALLWVAQGSFFAGLIIYMIGRLSGSSDKRQHG